MLEGTKEIYENVADSLIPDWRNMNKNELMFKACDCTNSVDRNGYVSALMSKYWYKISQYYNKCKMVATPEDVHTWLTTAVLYALDNQPWKNPKSSIYNDSEGPDKVINRVMMSRKATFYQQLNRYNRKINSTVVSLDYLVEEFQDTFAPAHNDEYSVVYNQLVVRYFEKQEYFLSFILDAILYEDVLIDGHFRKSRLIKHLKGFNEVHCGIFAERYNLPIKEVEEAISHIRAISVYVMKTKVEYYLIRLKQMLAGE